MAVNPIDDVMNYYIYAFISIYVLFIISIIVTVLSFKLKNLIKYFIPINILSFLSLAANLIFMGVLADNQAPTNGFWSIQTAIFLFIIFVMIVIQICLLVKNNKNFRNN